jgi:orotidine-5'-phosphate decarboxylase
MTSDARSRICCALDVPSLDEADKLAEAVSSSVGFLKVGLEQFVAHGPEAVRRAARFGCEIFLDLKLHDIPETVGRSVARARDLGVKLLTIHAGGGRAMIEAAVRATEGSSLEILCVTVLTSLDEADLKAVGVEAPLASHAARLGSLSIAAGAHGLVSSSHELSDLRARFPEARLVTPGIRPSGGVAPTARTSDDQKRIATPKSAIQSGSSLLVVGRPLRDAPSPADAAAALLIEVTSALTQA